MRVVVAEDSMLFREGLVRVLEASGHEVVGAFGDATSLLAGVGDLAPDLVIIDVRMPPDLESDGARAAVSIRKSDPDTAMVLLSQHIELRHCLDLIGTPGFGYLLKDRVLDLEQFEESLQRTASGGTALDPEVVRALVRSKASSTGLGGLTEREQEVLALVAQGHSNSAVAAELRVSERTVETHMRSVFTKLGMHDDGSTHRRVLAVVTYLGAHA